ncbi:hypothetical protein ACFQPA_12770 [Halomarina halobia]|uniref:DUF3311 domain-containing protein n=1 Tax=Halomarina halobia TaxID=3033386 RepID=A0ABD6A914_9EURY|nr:hypothetical protein [Halomarina sp. PSR21]
MKTHVKEATTTLVTFLALVGTVHAGIWFSLFGVPEVTVLNWPFHYFWFVVGAWASIFAIYWGYHRVVDGIEEEKRRLGDDHARVEDRPPAVVGEQSRTERG